MTCFKFFCLSSRILNSMFMSPSMKRVFLKFQFPKQLKMVCEYVKVTYGWRSYISNIEKLDMIVRFLVCFKIAEHLKLKPC
jgi:hypothetical protein